MSPRLALLLFLVVFIGCSRNDREPALPGDEALRKVTLQLNWFPEHEHGGFYEALVEGHYRDQGLDVRILPGGPKVAVAHQLVTGRADFTLAGADEVLLARAQDAQLISLFAPIDQSPRCVMVHETSGITSLRELRGTVALKGGSPFVTFLEANGYLDNSQVVPFFGGIGRFVTNPDYSQQAYSFSEPILARREGTRPRVLMLADVGFNPYMGTLATLASTARDDPDLVRRFTQASLKGWKNYLADPSKTNRHLASLNDELDEGLLAEGVEALRQLCHPPESPDFGKMESGRWQALADQMVELHLIPAESVEIEKAYTDEFLSQ